MNRIHKHIWSRTLERLVVVCEGKRGARGQKSTRCKLGALVAAATFAAPLYAEDLPTGAEVVAGAGTIETNGNAMTVNQSTDRMIANWQSFSIGAGNTVTFHQPGTTSVALNRVVGDSASQILGNLSANGQVFLVNPNGVLFGQGSQVNVGALVASTLGIDDESFLSANYRFIGEGGEIRNAGVLDGAVVALIAPVVTNEGTINGSAALAGGSDVTLDFNGNGLLSVRVDAATVATLVENRGLIQTHGETAILTARGASAALASAVNNSGVIQATSLTRQGGRILLDAAGGQTTVTGTADASSESARGGAVVVTGERVLLEDTARLAATGGAGGGEIYVGGSWQGQDSSIRQAVGTAVASGAVLDASATNSGDGGTVVAWSDIHDQNSVTRAYGTFLARGGANGGDGGRIETSGHWLDTGGIKGDASAAHGLAGEWLFDPYNVTISAGASSNIGVVMGNPNLFTPSGDNSNIRNTDLNSWLNGGTNVRVITGTAGTQIGDIYVNAPITRTIGGADATLTLRATNSIVINQAISASAGRVNLVLDADYDSGDDSGNGAGVVMLAANINTNGGNLSFGSGRMATIGGVETLVGGDVFVSGAGARTLTTGGGALDVYGELIIANTNGLSVATGGGNVRFWGLVNSGNQYTYVDGPDGEIDSWDYARTDARNGTAGGAAVGDSYLVNITSRLENSVAVASAGYRGSWIGAYRPDWASPNWTWADGPEAGVHFYTQADPDSGSPTAGYYANFGYGEPNGCMSAADCETVGQFFGEAGEWNDLGAGTEFQATQASIYAVLGYVRETNINSSPLVVNAGAGTVTFSDGVGSSKALASLNVSGGSVTIANGARTTGTQAIDALSGNLAITGAINSSDTTSSAIILNAGRNAAAGTAAGGNIIVGGGSSISVGAGGRATLYTGSVSGSTGLPSLIGSGSGRFRYNSDEVSTNYSTALATGAYAIFREQPTVAITANQTITYGQAPAPTWSASGLQNGDTSLQAISSGPSVAMNSGATLSSAGRYTAGSHTIDVTGSAAGGLGYAFNIANGTLTVNAATISAITGIAAQNRTYNGITAATLTTGGAGFTGMVAGDVLSVGTANGAFVDRHAGVGKTVNITGLSLAGADAANYVLGGTTASTTASISRAALTVSSANVIKTYDGTVAANGSGIVTSGQLYVSDALSGGAFAFTNRNASSGDKTVTVANVAVNDGNSGNNYDVTFADNTSSTINRAAITTISGIAAQNRIYDGTVAATLNTGGASFNGMIGGDALSVGAGSGTFANRNAGTGKTVSITGLALAGADAGNYTLASAVASTTADITPATISAITDIAAQNRIYDGTTAATLNTASANFTGMIVGDGLSVGAGSGTFANRHAGTGKTVNIAGLTLAGADAANYVLASTTASTTASISRAALTVSTADVVKTYDGTVAANGSSIVTSGQLYVSDALSGGAFAFTDKNAGSGDKTVTVANVTVNDGNGGNNYDVTLAANTTSTVNRATIADISGVSAQNRTYDGTVAAALNTGGASFNGMIAGDALSVGAANGAFADRNAGAGKTVSITGLALAGTDAGNYTLESSVASTTATIGRAALSVSSADVVKTYDGTLAANGSAVVTAGQLFASDALSGGTFAFTDKNARTGDKTATLANVAVDDGNGGNNYDVTLIANTTSTINRASIAGISGIAAQSRVYDGTTAATLDAGGASFNGMIVGDVLSVGAANGAFANRHAGVGKTVSIIGLSLAGADAANYVLGGTTASTTADITPATISAITGISAHNRMYDGTTAATLDTGGAVFNHLVAGDSLTVASAAGVFDGANPGIGKNVFITGLSLGGADVGNYVLADETARATANIGALTDPLPLPPAPLTDSASLPSQTGDSLASLATPAQPSPGHVNSASETGQSTAPDIARAPALTAMSVVEAPGSAVLVTFALSSDGRLTVHVPQDVAVGSLGGEDDLRRLASEKLGVEPGRILSIQVISGMES